VQRVLEPLDVRRFARHLVDRPMLRRRNDPCEHAVLIGVKRRLLPGRFRHLGPQALCTPAAAIPRMDCARDHFLY